MNNRVKVPENKHTSIMMIIMKDEIYETYTFKKYKSYCTFLKKKISIVSILNTFICSDVKREIIFSFHNHVVITRRFYVEIEIYFNACHQ